MSTSEKLVLIEATGEEPDESQTSFWDRLKTLPKKSLNQVLELIPTVAEALHTQLSAIDPAPQEVCVEFGCNLSTKGTLYVASIGSDTTFKIQLKWAAKPPLKAD